MNTTRISQSVKSFFGLQTHSTARVKFNRRQSDRPLTIEDVRKKYQMPRSFTDMLPWVDYLSESQCFLLDDYKSVGAVYEITPTACEGRPEQFLLTLQEDIQNMFGAIPERDQNPWVMQLYAQDDETLLDTYEHLEQSIPEDIRETEFTQDWLARQKQHLDDISHTDSLFFDDTVTDSHWSGKSHRVRMVFYRRQGANEKLRRGLTPEIELNNTLKKVEAMLKAAGVRAKRCDGEAFFYWMLRWFNPKPAMTGGDPDKFKQLIPYPEEDELPEFHDFAEGLLFSMPRSDDEEQCWYFDEVPHRVLSVQRLNRVPKPGQMTAERKHDKFHYAFMDRLPKGSIVAMSIVFKPQDVIQNHLSGIIHASVGDEDEAQLAAEEATHAKRQIALKNKFHPVNMSIYIKADTLEELDTLTYEVDSLLVSNDLQPIDLNSDLLSIDSYLKNLPMAYDVEFDQFSRRSRFMHSLDASALSPFFGRTRGSGNPGINEFNRGGEAVFFDPIRDRKQNAHMVTLGPTGAGKSSHLVKIIQSMFAIHRPRLFLIESGNSFGLLGEHMQRLGVSVNQMRLKPGTKVSIPPFRDAIKLLGNIDKSEIDNIKEVEEPETHPEEDDPDEKRDLLGEMEISAKIMITGGEEGERFAKSDRLIVRHGIYRAAENVANEGREQTMISDVVNGIREISKHELTVNGNQKRGERAAELADSMELFSGDDFIGDLFNKEGDYWPEVDVTIVDLAHLTREGKETELAVAYTGLMNTINNIIEKYEYDPRPTIVLTDEGHVITKNPLLAPYVVKMTKMWRKLGTWYWIATQNMKDFPDQAETMLNMIEWWVCLAMPSDEIEQISRFKTLSEEQKAMMLSAQKAPPKFTEGVIMSKDHNDLFRNVPPSLDLALAMTEKDEKAERFALMKEFCFEEELDAAYKKAELIREERLSLTEAA